MRSRSHLVPVAVAAVLALSACQDPDVGQDCDMPLQAAGGGPLDVPTPPPDGPLCSSDPFDRADYFRTGAIECDNLVCVRSSTGTCAADASLASIRHYCSKPCVSDRDCFTGETGLVCRQIVLDPVFLATLPPDVRARYLGQIQASNYCATPVSQ